MIPASTWSTIRAPSRESSTTSPLSAMMIDDAGTPASCASRACAASIRYSPWIGITAFGPDQAEQGPKLLRACMPGDVDGGVLLVQHLCAAPGQPVDRVVDAQLVPGNGARRDDHRVAARDVHRRVVVVGDPREGRQGLALGAGAEDQLALGRQLVEICRAGRGGRRAPRCSRGSARCSGSCASSGRSR